MTCPLLREIGFCRYFRRGLLLLFAGMLAPHAWAHTHSPSVDLRPPLRFAVLAFRPVPETLSRWQPVADYLGTQIPSHRVELVALNYADLEHSMYERRVDLVLTQPAHYVALSVKLQLYSPLATLVESEQGFTLNEFGGVIFTQARHSSIKRLEDVRNRSVATSLRESLGAFYAQAFELQEIGIRLKPEQVIETGTQDAVITALQQGLAEVGFVRTGLLEQLAKEGKLSLSDFRVLQADTVPDYPLLLSTRLYPQWALAAMPWLDASVARQVAGAMLSLPHDGDVARQARITGFTIPGDYRSVDRLMRALRVPPFDARVPVQIIWEDHRPAVVALALLLLSGTAWILVISLRARLQRRQSLTALKESERRFFDFADAASDWFWEMGPDMRFTYFSERIAETLGASPAQLIGKTRREIMDPADVSQKWEAHFDDLDRHLAFKDFEYRLVKPDGTIRFIKISGKPVFAADGAFQGYRGIGQDITTFKEQQRRLERFAHYDALTQLPNRVLLADRLDQAIHQAERRHSGLAVVYLDLDGFKAVNDLHGHATGDKLLVELSNRLKQTLREGDTLARLGGDEFVAVLIDLKHPAESTPILDRMLEQAAMPVWVDGQSLHVSGSLGVSFFPQTDPLDADQLLRQADQAMYVAKQSGRNRYHIFDADQDRAIRGRHESVEHIREALERQEFVLHYQPKVNMRSGAVVGFEALIRWQHPERGLIPPSGFLPLIEDHDLITQVGDWVIETALQQMEAWQALAVSLPVSVNVAGRQLQSPGFLDTLRARLARHPAVAHMLELEVLESSALEVSQVSQLIADCQKMGVSFSLDDFGTGYSSLTYLKRLPAHTLKIDQSFVRDMLEDPDDLAILDGIIGLSESFQRHLIAEGVETREHCQMLLHLGCDIGQGYALARPMPAHAIIDWLTTRRHAAFASTPERVGHDGLPILFAMTEHRAWVKALLLFLHDQQTEPPVLDQHQCRFGQWLNKTGLQLFAHHPALPDIIAMHANIHRRANELVTLKQHGGRQDEWQHLGTLEIAALRDELLRQLESLLADLTGT